MRKSLLPDGVLVFDRYYGSKPNTAVLIVERILFSTLLAVFSMLFFIKEYGFDVPLSYVAAVTAVCSVLFSAVFVFVSRRIALPVLFVAIGVASYFNLDDIWKRLSFFVDEAMLLTEGRFLYPAQFLFNPSVERTSSNKLYVDGMYLGVFLLCMLYSLLCAASMKKHIKCLPSLVGFVILCIPTIIAERFELNIWLFPAILMFAAAAAIGAMYRNGLAVVKTGAGAYRRQVRNDERAFLGNIEKADTFKRISMKFSFFSKYLTSGIYCALIFTVALAIGLSSFGEGKSMDYTGIYNFIAGIGKEVGSDSPFESGPASDYFTSDRERVQTRGLSITSPGSGETAMLEVTFEGENPLYLRGDIGIDYTGDGWTTHVTDQSKWEASNVAETYRPCELDVVRTLLSAFDYKFSTVVEKRDVAINYLCETDIVFLPAYISDYSFYKINGFDVFGDYVVRVDTRKGDYIRNIECTSLAYDFKEYGTLTPEEIIADIKSFFTSMDVSVDGFYNIVVPEMTEANIIFDYRNYAENVYLNIPDNLGRELRSFMAAEIPAVLELAENDAHLAKVRYGIANILSDYLRDNYDYTLSGVNQSSSPVMEFLTETKRGHCSLYASALTLMLRELGIPARYCTGFAVHPNSALKSTVMLREKNLHAWVEVYLGELGWVTFDPTSGAANAVQEERPVEIPDEDTSSETSQPEDKPETPASPSVGEVDEPQADNAAIIPMEIIAVCAAVLLITAVIAVLIYRYKAVKSEAEGVLRRAEAFNGRCLYSVIIEILYLLKLKPSEGVLPSDYYAEADKLFKTSLSEHKKVLEKAAFAKSKLSDGEISELCVCLRTLYENTVKSSNIVLGHRVRRAILNINSENVKI